jgi:catechol 2,3-dioxygenase-like lactoylglutathione lyase family enzyme
MKRLHVHVSVADLARSIRFYSTLFAAEPTLRKPDYAKWMLDDPRVNFAISARGGRPGGLNHLGIQVETQGELREVYGRLEAAERPVLEEGATTCCYARSEGVDHRPPRAGVGSLPDARREPVYGDGADLGAIRIAADGACGAPPSDPRASACCGPQETAAA